MRGYKQPGPGDSSQAPSQTKILAPKGTAKTKNAAPPPGKTKYAPWNKWLDEANAELKAAEDAEFVESSLGRKGNAGTSSRIRQVIKDRAAAGYNKNPLK